MDHSYYRDRISAFFDHQLPPQEEEAIRQHLSDCKECRQLLSNIECLERVVDEQSQLAEDGYWERSAQKIERQLGFEADTPVTDIKPSGWRGLVPKLVAAAAAVAVLTFVGLYQGDISRSVFRDREALRIPPPSRDSLEVEPRKPTPSKTIIGGDKVGAESEKKRTDSVPAAFKREDVEVKVPAGMQEEYPAVAEVDTDVRMRSTGEGGSEPQTKAGVPPEPQPRLGSPELREVAAVDTGALSPKGAEGKGLSVQRLTDLSASGVLPPSRGPAEAAAAESLRANELFFAETAGSQMAAESEVTDETDTFDYVLPDLWKGAATLEQWRERRDSLQTIHANVTSHHYELAKAKFGRDSVVQSIGEVEQLLLYSCYQIARLTDNDDERTDAVDFLRRYVAESSRFSSEARLYLHELGIEPD